MPRLSQVQFVPSLNINTSFFSFHPPYPLLRPQEMVMYVSPPSSCSPLPSEKKPGSERLREGLFTGGRGRRGFADRNAAGLSGT